MPNICNVISGLTISLYCQYSLVSIIRKMIGKYVQKGSRVTQMYLMWASVLLCHHWKTNSTAAPNRLITLPDTMKHN